MGESDDRLAPVTPIFGSRPSDELPTLRSMFGPPDDEPGPDDDLHEVGTEVHEDGIEVEEGAFDETLTARDAAVRTITRRDVSQRELERFLRDKGYAEPTIAEVVRDMQAHGYQDDTAGAQRLVARLQERKGLGRTAIAAELARRMFAPAAISYALELVDSGDELARARELAEKRARQLGGLDRETAVRRLSGYLQRRGYSGSTVRSAVDAALPATGFTSGVRFR